MSRTMSQRQIEERLAAMRIVDPSYGPTPTETEDGANNAAGTAVIPNESQISWTGTKNTAPAVSVGTPIKHFSKLLTQKITKWATNNVLAPARKEIPCKKHQRSTSPVQRPASKHQCLFPPSTGGDTERGALDLSPILSPKNAAMTSTPIKDNRADISKNDTICLDISLSSPVESAGESNSDTLRN